MLCVRTEATLEMPKSLVHHNYSIFHWKSWEIIQPILLTCCHISLAQSRGGRHSQKEFTGYGFSFFFKGKKWYTQKNYISSFSTVIQGWLIDILLVMQNALIQYSKSHHIATSGKKGIAMKPHYNMQLAS